MFAVFVRDNNLDAFLTAVPRGTYHDADFIIGAVEEETDTACGVLTVKRDGPDGLLITFVFVDERYRNRGAGRAMLEFLKSAAKGFGALWIRCMQTRFYGETKNENLDAISGLLYACGFSENGVASIYECELSEIRTLKRKSDCKSVPLKGLSERDFRKANVGLYGEVDLKEIMSGVGKARQKFDGEYSQVLFDAKGAVLGAILVKVADEVPCVDRIVLRKEAEKVVVIELVSVLVRRLKQDYAPDARVNFVSTDAETLDYINAFTGGKERKVGEVYRQFFVVPI